MERILGSHSSVYSAGELNDFSQALVEAVIAAAGTRSIPRQELVARSAKLDFEAWAATISNGHDPRPARRPTSPTKCR